MKKIFATFSVIIALVVAAGLSACGAPGAQSDKTITVGASSSPHAEILRAAAPELEKNGYTLDVQEFSDWVLPNSSLAAGELDANYFQHLPYLENFNAENNADLVSAGAIHFEPLSLFTSKGDDYKSIKDGAKIGVPSDTTNEARALLLLQNLGLITLTDGAGLNATKQDITANPHHLEIVEAEAASLPRLLEDLDFAVINGNFALSAGLDANKVQASEDAKSAAAQEYANIIAVQPAQKDNPKIKALIAALQSDTVRDYINNTYQGRVVPVF